MNRDAGVDGRGRGGEGVRVESGGEKCSDRERGEMQRERERKRERERERGGGGE